MLPWFTTSPIYHLIDWASNEYYHQARFEKESRYYVIRLSKDLLKDWVVTLINGRIKTKLGQSRTLAFTHFNDAFDNFCMLANVRHQRGYQLKEFFSENPILMHLLPYSVISDENKALVNVETIKKIRPGKTVRINFTPKKNKESHGNKFTQMGFSF